MEQPFLDENTILFLQENLQVAAKTKPILTKLKTYKMLQIN